MTSDTVRELLIIAVLIALNAVFVAAEIALVTARGTRLDQLAREGSRSARRARLVEQSREQGVIDEPLSRLGFDQPFHALNSGGLPAPDERPHEWPEQPQCRSELKLGRYH